MSFLEKKIKENKAFFDHHEPDQGHLERFIQKLDSGAAGEDEKSDRWLSALKIAAVGLVFIAMSWFVFNFSFSDLSSAVLQEVIKIELPQEMEELFAYYDSKAEQKMGMIDELAPNEQEAERIKDAARSQLQHLDAQLAAIEKEYMINPENEELEAALRNHKMMKTSVLDNIISQISHAMQPAANSSLTN